MQTEEDQPTAMQQPQPGEAAAQGSPSAPQHTDEEQLQQQKAAHFLSPEPSTLQSSACRTPPSLRQPQRKVHCNIFKHHQSRASKVIPSQSQNAAHLFASRARPSMDGNKGEMGGTDLQSNEMVSAQEEARDEIERDRASLVFKRQFSDQPEQHNYLPTRGQQGPTYATQQDPADVSGGSGSGCGCVGEDSSSMAAARRQDGSDSSATEMLLPFAANKQLIFNSGCGETNSSGSQKSGRNDGMAVVKPWGGLNQQLEGSGAVNSLLITEEGDGDACSNQQFTNSTPSPDSMDPFRRPAGGADCAATKVMATASQGQATGQGALAESSQVVDGRARNSLSPQFDFTTATATSNLNNKLGGCSSSPAKVQSLSVFGVAIENVMASVPSSEASTMKSSCETERKSKRPLPYQASASQTSSKKLTSSLLLPENMLELSTTVAAADPVATQEKHQAYPLLPAPATAQKSCENSRSGRSGGAGHTSSRKKQQKKRLKDRQGGIFDVAYRDVSGPTQPQQFQPQHLQSSTIQSNLCWIPDFDSVPQSEKLRIGRAKPNSLQQSKQQQLASSQPSQNQQMQLESEPTNFDDYLDDPECDCSPTSSAIDDPASDFEGHPQDDSENSSQINNEATHLQLPIAGQRKKKNQRKCSKKDSICCIRAQKTPENHWERADRDGEAISEISGDGDGDLADAADYCIDDARADSDAGSFEVLKASVGEKEETTAATTATASGLLLDDGPSAKKTREPGLAARFEHQMQQRANDQVQHSEGLKGKKAVQMDRFIPCRTQETLQAKFEAASQNQSDFWASKRHTLLQQHGSTHQSSAHRAHLYLPQQAPADPLRGGGGGAAGAPPAGSPASPEQYQTIFRGVSQASAPAMSLSSSQPASFGGGIRLPAAAAAASQQAERGGGRLLRASQLTASSRDTGEDGPLPLPTLDPLHLNPQHSLPAPTTLELAPPLESASASSKTLPKPSDGEARLKSYNLLLEKSIFFEQGDVEGNAMAERTNLTTDIDKELGLSMQGLSLLYQTSCKTHGRQASLRQSASMQADADDIESLYMKENLEASSESPSSERSTLLTGKVLRFKKQLSGQSQAAMSSAAAIETSRVAQASSMPSIVQEYQPSKPSLLQPGTSILAESAPSTLGTDMGAGFSNFGNNPLSSLDYLTAGLGSSASVTASGSYGGCGQGGGSPDNILINRIRRIAPVPYKILDAPHLCDDFYLNLVDWSATNILAVALAQHVYIWNANTSSVHELVDLGERNRVTSVSWSQGGTHLSVGTYDGQVQIWDVQRRQRVRTMAGHLNRVSVCAWSNSVVASGSKDKQILVRDVRASSNFTKRLRGHRQEVCGLRWSPHDDKMLASGGNDNKLMIWSVNHGQSDGNGGEEPLAKFGQHQAAVKAINWSPLHRGLLATGGGTADQHIRFWNMLNLQPISAINTGSQVCNLVFSKTNDELVSTHGYSLNQVIVWKYPTMEKIATLTGHTYRVLYLAMSPDGSSIVTGAGDETLRFWNVFPKSRSNRGAFCGNNDIIGSGTSSLFPSNVDFR